MLLPALSKAKGMAHQIHCMNNMKQIGLAYFAYATDYDDWVPLQRNGFEVGNETRLNWQFKMAPYLGVQNPPLDLVTHIATFICKADTKGEQINSERIPTNYGYTMQMGCLGSEGWQWDPANPGTNWWFRARRLGRFTRPDMVVCLADLLNNTTIVTPYGVAPASMWPSFTQMYVFGSTSNKIDMFRHSNKANMLFVDGHVTPGNPMHMTNEQVQIQTGIYYPMLN
jgi:prepilin-type processing-associated H-X9-DG protein